MEAIHTSEEKEIRSSRCTSATLAYFSAKKFQCVWEEENKTVS